MINLHVPWGEITITLEDVKRLVGIRVERTVLNDDPPTRNFNYVGGFGNK